MAYTPKTWTCGETITDNGLNNIEQGIQEALAGGGNLPEVTSADDDKVLTVVNGEWAKADRGYKCDGDNVETTECFEKAVESLLGYECEETELLSETVTTLADDVVELSSHVALSEDILTITFDGVEYECPKTVQVDMMGTSNIYGGDLSEHDFSEYPFIVQSLSSAIDPSVITNNLWTKDAGQHTIKVGTQSVSTTECFEKAVKSVVDTGFECVDEIAFDGQLTTTGVSREATIPYDKLIDAKTIVVEFNGAKHELTRTNDADTGGSKYSASDNSFIIKSYYLPDGTLQNELTTATAGTYTIKITIPEGKAETSDCFKTAVKSVVGDVDKGYECKETATLFTQESVTTTDIGMGAPSGQFTYSEPLTADKLWVTFNGTEYVCDKVISGPVTHYGDWNDSTSTPDFSRYPFYIASFMGNQLNTEAEGTYNIKLEVRENSIETSECFEKARGYSCTESFTELFTETFTYDNAPSNYTLDYSGEISAPIIKVTLNGTEYICDRTMSSGTARYGDSDLIAYPFALRSSLSLEGGYFNNRFKAPNNGDYTLKVEALGTSAETSDCFDLAVKSVIENNSLETRGYKCAEDRSDVSDCFTKAVKKILSITDATIVNSDGGLVSEPDYVVADLLNFALPVYIKEGDLQSMIFSSFQDGDGKWHFIVFDEYGTPREYITNNDGFPEWVSH